MSNSNRPLDGPLVGRSAKKEPDRHLGAAHARSMVALVITLSAVLVVVWILAPDYVCYLAAGACLLLLFTEAVGFMIGFAGMPNFGPQLQFGAGAYVAAVLSLNLHTDDVVGLVGGVLVGTVLALGFAVLWRPEASFAFGLVTLSLGQFAYLFVSQSPYVYGESGIPGVGRGAILGLSLSNDFIFLVLVAVVTCCGSYGLWRLRRSTVGMIIRACRDSWPRAESLGIRIRPYQTLALAVGGAISGLAGSLYVYWLGAAGPAVFNWTFGAGAILGGLLGGIRTFIGPILGGAIYQGLSTSLQPFTRNWALLISTIVLVTFLIRPAGITGTSRRVGPLRWLQSWRLMWWTPLRTFNRLARSAAKNISKGMASVETLLTGVLKVRRRRGRLLTEVREQVERRPSRSRRVREKGIVIRDLDGYYGALWIVKGVSLTISPGVGIALVGRNGVGKTSILRAITGSFGIRATGQVFVDGTQTIHFGPDAKARIGVAFVPTDRRIFPLSVEENLRLAKSGRKLASDNYEAALEAFPFLADKLERRGDTLSGGEQQALAIARAMIGGPRYLLLDEPTEGLAPMAVGSLVLGIRKLVESTGVGLLLIDRNTTAINALCSEVYGIAGGRIVYRGSTDEYSQDETTRTRLLALT